MCVFRRCPPPVGSVGALGTDQACTVKGIACGADTLFVKQVRDAMTDEAGTADDRVFL